MVRRSSAAPVALAARVHLAAWWTATALLVLGVSGSPASAQDWGSVGVVNFFAGWPTDAGKDDHWPVVAFVGAGTWVAVWESNFVGPDYDILIARSFDNGATWPAQFQTFVNTNALVDSGDDLRPQIATDGAGNLVAVWYSGERLCDPNVTECPLAEDCDPYVAGCDIGTDTDILVATSDDYGATWTDPVALNTNAASDWGWDWFPQVATDGAGKWVAVWQSREWLGGTIGTDRDILWAYSSDNGATWTDPAALNTNAASDSGDDFYPQITADGPGSWVVVWRSDDSLDETIGTDSDILWARWDGVGATWTDPVPLNNNAASDSRDDFRPQVSTDGEGKWVAVWHSEEPLCNSAVTECLPDSQCNPFIPGCSIGTDMDILWARWDGVGATWTNPEPLNTNAAVDIQDAQDFFAGAAFGLADDDAGNWVAVWNSSADIKDEPVVGDPIGPDFDILWAGWASSHDVTITQITNNGASDLHPAIWGSNVVWYGNADGDNEIYRWNGVTIIKVTNNSTQDIDPDVWGPNATPSLVWDDGSGKLRPVLWGSNQAWYGDDGNDNEIYFWDGATTTQLTNNDSDDRNPAIWGSSVVWEGHDGNDYEIYLWDGATTTQVTNNDADDRNPAVSGLNVVWDGHDGNDTEIYLWDGVTTTQITDNSADDLHPAISGWSVVWYGNEDGDNEIYLWEGATPVQITDNSADDLDPAISGRSVVWQGNQDGDYEIYLYKAANWTAPLPLNSTAVDDEEGDYSAHVVSDGLGNWVVLWHSHDPGLNIGLDADILRTIGTGPYSDSDALPDAAEVNVHGTDPFDPDSDGDGLDDGAEVNVHGSDPLEADSDGDGLDDGTEVNVYGTDPVEADSDGDGLSDGAEVETYDTNPLDWDSDGDHFGDAYEIAEGTDPNDPASRPLIPVPALAPLGRALAALLLALAAWGWLARRRA